jgi:hypothetical protein
MEEVEGREGGKTEGVSEDATHIIPYFLPSPQHFLPSSTHLLIQVRQLPTVQLRSPLVNLALEILP